MDGFPILFYVALVPFQAGPIQMINGAPQQMPSISLPTGTMIVADPSIVINGMIMPNKIISYPVAGQGGLQMLQVAETTTPIQVGDGGS